MLRRELATNPVPVVPGGGTVAYVNESEHRYLADPEHREEGGTPAIIESIRAGVVFRLKSAVGVETIHAREKELLGRAMAAWRAEPALEILGNVEAKRLSIVSFVVRAPAGSSATYLHHNHVVALFPWLNDIRFTEDGTMTWPRHETIAPRALSRPTWSRPSASWPRRIRISAVMPTRAICSMGCAGSCCRRSV